MSTQTEYAHIPVLQEQVIRALNLTGQDFVVDATFGRGGHSRSIMEKLSEHARLIVIDRDESAIETATKEWGSDNRVDIVHAPFSKLREILAEKGLLGSVTAILFDFGVSSPQLDDPGRGFSFLNDGPLDMRMDRSRGITAETWLNQVEEAELVSVLKRFGEERFAKRIARSIKTVLTERPIRSTGQLAEIIEKAVPKKEIGKHPATRSFQAIRIAVNDELGEIESALDQVVEALAPGGRVVIISFHSLEDRMVKRFFKQQAKGDPYPADLPITQDMLRPNLKLVGKPMKADDSELDANRRARSAVMRVAEKVG